MEDCQRQRSPAILRLVVHVRFVSLDLVHQFTDCLSLPRKEWLTCFHLFQQVIRRLGRLKSHWFLKHGALSEM